MRFRFRPLAAGAVLGLLLRAPVAAQAPAPPLFAVEPQFSIAFPRGAIAEHWGLGVGLGVQFSVLLDQRYALYAGYSGTEIGRNLTGGDHAIDRGLAAGVVGSFPGAGGRPVVPWVRAGVLAHQLAVVRRGDAGEETGPADGSVGLEVGAGIGMQRTPSHARLGRSAVRAYPTLGLDYRAYRARVLGPERESVSYVALRSGVALAF